MVATPWEHLQNVVNQTFTRRVRDAFSDVTGNDDNISTPRASLRRACLPTDRDSAQMLAIRMMLFYFVIFADESLRPNLYTMPSDRYQQMVRFAPQVVLYFKEDPADVELGFAPIDAEISFRLRSETSANISWSDVDRLANDIRREFSGAGGYRWRKGRVKVTYQHMEQGYWLSINASSESEAREVIRKILSIQNHSFDESRMAIHTLAQAPPTVPPMQSILGRSRRAPRRRPTGTVRFLYAELHLHGIPNAIVLVDRLGRRDRARRSV